VKYVRVPDEIDAADIAASEYCFSPAKYLRFLPTAVNSSRFLPLDQIVVVREERMRVKRGEIYRYAEIGDIDIHTGGVSFRTLRGFQVPNPNPAIACDGDVLVSTVRTYRGGIGRVNGVAGVTSTALLNFSGVTSQARYLGLDYVYSFLRSAFFTEQVWSMINRGVYPRMDRGALQRIALPACDDAGTVKYVSALTRAIADKEAAIRSRSGYIFDRIDAELRGNQRPSRFAFEHPTTDEIRSLGRLDARIYDEEYKAKIWLMKNYRYGASTPSADGFEVIPGPSLEDKLLGTRIDSDRQRAGFYGLILPTNMSPYGTMNAISWLGTGKKLPLLRKGDIVFGERGLKKAVQ
jgi:hypothetical protein